MDGGEERLVAAAQAGDAAARERLVSGCLPLVYNVVGRALDGHADVDDVVQDTMLRMLNGLGGLRDPSRFRSWLVAIAMNQVRRRWSANRRRPAVGLDAAHEIPDPDGDFVEITIVRLGLSGQRKEIAEATRWLDPADRDLLSLWWLEVSGELTRAELAAALDVKRRHAAVRVNRMKEQLETGRLVVRALAATPPCPGLAELTSSWNGRPTPVWRKRIARHARGCDACRAHRHRLAPAEVLLAGMVLVPPPAHLSAAELAGFKLSGADVALHASHGARNAVIAGTSVVAAVAVAVWFFAMPGDEQRPSAAPPSTPVATPSATPVSPDPSPTPSRTRRSPKPRKTSKPPLSPGRQVIRLANIQRARHGCRPLRENPMLTRAAQKHSADMAARRVLSHDGASGQDPGARITAAGYRWRAWAENIQQGAATPSSAVSSWMTSTYHRANILNCDYTEIGVGFVSGAGGPWWTQDFASPQ
ncbi:RNA polymerase sigma factor (sigma-70 family) [Actinomadura luteofluorescens]|uniref:RNA polymerase sigma factor (Sigma-70 family) n=1 Tax=Actinomadura luteofluorescens TaxID=46163 RepID=A0A7Y9EHN4_9ACTN|nr:sigma-70 family RNA polymerase sigma factor [Actinomadura luteofluorescens]NYD47746.1 RNA polymerase sigma factor (sigma-70 family) [Actinomadura luteofluorescens]